MPKASAISGATLPCFAPARTEINSPSVFRITQPNPCLRSCSKRAASTFNLMPTVGLVQTSEPSPGFGGDNGGKLLLP
uniref:Uncharacterized protein n=1 Tax=Cannabis sativa TaxID=3483 RepID=A0A803RC34_CANSA